MKKKVLIIGGIIIVTILVVLASLYLYQNHQRKEEEKQKQITINNTKERYNFFKTNQITISNTKEKDLEYLNNIITYQEDNNKINIETFKTNLFNEKNYKDDIENISQTITTEIDKYTNIIPINEKEFTNLIPKNLDKETALKIYKQNNTIKNIETENQKRTDYINNLNEILNDINQLKEKKEEYTLSNNIYIAKNNNTKTILDNFSTKYNLNLKTQIEVIKTPTYSGKKGLVPILCYHGVLDNPWGITSLFVKVAEFEKQMKYLKDNGYTTLFASEITSANNYEKPVIITFDDGYKDIYTNAWPILQKYNQKGNSYIISGWIGGDVYMNNNMIKEIHNSPNFEIGSHTVTHRQLATLSNEDIEYEVRQSKQDLENLLGSPINVIAYPVGSYDNRVLNIVSKYYKYGLSTDNGMENPNNPNTYNLKRIYVMRDYNINTFASLLN